MGYTAGKYFESDIEGWFQIILVIINHPLALFPENNAGKQRPYNVSDSYRLAGQKCIPSGTVFKDVGQNLERIAG